MNLRCLKVNTIVLLSRHDTQHVIVYVLVRVRRCEVRNSGLQTFCAVAVSYVDVKQRAFCWPSAQVE